MHEHDEDEQIEALFNNLPVRGPSRVLDERIAATLRSTHRDAAPPQTQRPWGLRIGAVAAALLLVGAATLVFVLRDAPPPLDTGPQHAQLPGDPPSDPASTDRAAVAPANYRFDPEPVDLRWSRDLGAQQRTAPNGRPYRAVLREVVDQRTWYDPDTGATMQVTTPREELVIRHQPTF